MKVCILMIISIVIDIKYAIDVILAQILLTTFHNSFQILISVSHVLMTFQYIKYLFNQRNRDDIRTDIIYIVHPH
jgi:hypothetical protein